MMRSKMLATGVALALLMAVAGASSVLAAESHPFLFRFGSFEKPNGIAIDQSTGDVYVAAIGTDTVYKFDASGHPLAFSSLGSNALTGAATPSTSFAFPAEVHGTPAAIAVDSSSSPSDPSAGDLYVMDGGHGVIDKFLPSGKYLNQIKGYAPAGSGEHELLGIAIDASGTLHIDIATRSSREFAVDEYDDVAENRLVAKQGNEVVGNTKGVPTSASQGHGFAVSSSGDNYPLYEAPCSCAVKLGQQLSGLGRMDAAESGDVGIAVDPVTGHVFTDVQSATDSVAEWDTGSMNESKLEGQEAEPAGSLVGRFGSAEPGQLSGSSGQGGIAVDGASGEIYVSNSADGKVHVFGSSAPALAVAVPGAVGTEAATLSGTVDPRGAAITKCQFEYGIANEYGQGSFEHSLPCVPLAAGIGSGFSPVAVSVRVEELQSGLLYVFRLAASSSGGSSESRGLLASAGVGFGVKGFEVSFLNEDGSPDTQAGSHPSQMLTSVTFNSHYMRTESNADSPYVNESDGTLKDLTVDLPPGLVGDPNATAKMCTPEQLSETGISSAPPEKVCPEEAMVGELQLNWGELTPYINSWHAPLYNMVAPRGVALQLGTNFVNPLLFINNGVRAGGEYPVEASIVDAPPAAPVITSRLTIKGVVGEGGVRKAFLTLPTGCHGPLRSTIEADSWQEPGHFMKKEVVTRNAAGTPVSLTGCSKLVFPPSISVSPDTTDASSSSGLTVGVHVPQTAAQNVDGLAESALRDTTVTLPEGVAINPSGGDGLQSCSEGLAGFTGFNEFNREDELGVQTATFTPEMPSPLMPGSNFCPDGSKVGTVKIKTPLLEHELEGAVYLAAQNANPFGSLIAMYLFVEDPVSGSVIKLTGEVHLTAAGQIVTTFENTPELPFEDLELHFFGGERAPLTTPARCGTYTATATFIPWDGNGPVTSMSSFQIEHGPDGGPCPGASLPFNPNLSGGTTNINAGGFSPLTTTISREDGNQDMQSVQLHMPAGLSGLLSGVKLCPEAQANEGTCGPESQIGETIVAAGVGSDPVSVTGGRVYITEKYAGAPFGLSIVNPVKAGPLDLEHDTSNPGQNPACDCIVVRAKIEVDPTTADLTITTDTSGPHAVPHLIDGIPVEIKHVNVLINRPGFTFNPTNCSPMAVTGSISSDEGATQPVSVPFQATNCATLAFKPRFKVSTSGKTSRPNGASLSVKLTYPKAPFGSQANIRLVKVELPKQLPSRLATLQKACAAAQFDTNPAGCPAASVVGHAKAITPLIPVPLEGPAYFVSHGGEAFPSLIVVLQGYGITIDLVGTTFINKQGITSSTFKTVPDQPVTSFELTLPQGKYSALAANADLCKNASKLKMPTEFVGQNEARVTQSTKISVTGCPKAKKAKKVKHKSKKKSRKGKK